MANRASHRGELLKLIAFGAVACLVLPLVIAVVAADLLDAPAWLPLIPGTLVLVLWVSFLIDWVNAWRHPERWTGERVTFRSLLRAARDD